MTDFETLRRLLCRAPRARLKVNRAWAACTRITSKMPDPNQIPHAGGTEGQEDRVLHWMETKEAFEEIERTIRSMQDDLRPYIAALPEPLQRTAMELRYLEGKTSQSIADTLFYSKQHIDRLLRRAETIITQEEQQNGKDGDYHGDGIHEG